MACVRCLFLHSFIDFLRSEQLLAVDKRAAHPFTDGIGIFAFERQNVCQKVFNTLIHRVSARLPVSHA